MSDHAKQLRVGIFAAIAITILVVTLLAMGAFRFWERRDHYTVTFDSSVYGLERGANVYMNGIKVGSVDDVKPDPQDLRRVRVTIAVKEGTPIKADTRARMQLAGFTGLREIDLRDGTWNAATLPPGSEISGAPATLDTLELQAKQVVGKSTKLLDTATHVVENLETMSKPEPIVAIVENLKSTSANLDGLVADQRAVLHSKLGPMLANGNELVGELRKLVAANAPAVRSSLTDLRQAARNLKDVSREVRQKPSRLLYSASAGDRRLP